MYYVPKKENSLGRVITLILAWDWKSGIHCLLLHQHSEICLGYNISYSLLTTSPRITLDELLHVISRTTDPLRNLSRNNSSLKKKKIIFSEVSENGRFSLSSGQIWILQA